MKSWVLRLAVVVLLVGLPPLLTTERASACVCERPSPQDALDQSVAVFAGRPVGWEELDWATMPEVFLVEFKVTRVWKGPPYETRWVGDSSNDCGDRFEEGVEYLIYGYTTDYSGNGSQTLLRAVCSALPLWSARDYLDHLGTGRPPESGWIGPRPGELTAPEPAETGTGTLTRPQETNGWTIAVATGATVLFAVWGRVALHRRRSGTGARSLSASTAGRNWLS